MFTETLKHNFYTLQICNHKVLGMLTCKIATFLYHKERVLVKAPTKSEFGTAFKIILMAPYTILLQAGKSENEWEMSRVFYKLSEVLAVEALQQYECAIKKWLNIFRIEKVFFATSYQSI